MKATTDVIWDNIGGYCCATQMVMAMVMALDVAENMVMVVECPKRASPRERATPTTRRDWYWCCRGGDDLLPPKWSSYRFSMRNSEADGGGGRDESNAAGSTSSRELPRESLSE